MLSRVGHVMLWTSQSESRDTLVVIKWVEDPQKMRITALCYKSPFTTLYIEFNIRGRVLNRILQLHF